MKATLGTSGILSAGWTSVDATSFSTGSSTNIALRLRREKPLLRSRREGANDPELVIVTSDGATDTPTATATAGPSPTPSNTGVATSTKTPTQTTSQLPTVTPPTPRAIISFSMPTIWEHGPYRFFFYSGDRDEPPGRVHVERERNKAKFWLDPVRLQNSGGYNRNEINRIQRLIEENQKMLLEKWNDYFSD